jgi:hypothetical protein
MIEKHLGKIVSVKFGLGGYQNSMIGLSLSFECKDGVGCGTFIDSFWSPSQIKHSEHTKWTEEDRDKAMAKMLREVDKIMFQANVEDVTELLNKPVEITLENFSLKSWRILEEVL